MATFLCLRIVYACVHATKKKKIDLVATETVWNEKPKIRTTWALIVKVGLLLV